MRWFKHMSHASNDEFMEKIEDEFGLEGYARWWKLLEAIATQMDKTNKCSVSYSWTKWQSLLKGKRNKLRTFLERLENESKINLKETGNVLEISCPNLLKFRDEYSKKSVQSTNTTPDKVRPKIQKQNTEVDKKKIPKKRFIKPTVEIVRKYLNEKGYLSIDPEGFVAYYESNGWLIGRNKTPMKCWKSAITTWRKNSGKNQQDSRGSAKKVADKLDDIAREDIEENGFTETLDRRLI